MAGRWRPDWGKQVNRWLAPDVDSWRHSRRSAKVTSLAHLFRHLGDRFTARALYDFYLTLRLVSAKKFRKGGILPRRARAEAYYHACEVIPGLCQELGLPIPRSRMEMAMLVKSVPHYLAAHTLAAMMPAWLPHEQPEPATGGFRDQLPPGDLRGPGGTATMAWQVTRQALVKLPLEAPPQELREVLENVGADSACGQCLYRCPKLVEAPRSCVIYAAFFCFVCMLLL